MTVLLTWWLGAIAHTRNPSCILTSKSTSSTVTIREGHGYATLHNNTKLHITNRMGFHKKTKHDRITVNAVIINTQIHSLFYDFLPVKYAIRSRLHSISYLLCFSNLNKHQCAVVVISFMQFTIKHVTAVHCTPSDTTNMADEFELRLRRPNTPSRYKTWAEVAPPTVKATD